MRDRTRGPRTHQPDSVDPIPYLRGLTHLIPAARLDAILARTTTRRRRNRLLLPSAVVWLVIAMSLFARQSIPLVWRYLHPSTGRPEPDPSAFTKARKRLGVWPLRDLFLALAHPIARPGTPGAFYRAWRLMGLDGTTLDIPDTPANARTFGRGGNQHAPNPFPQVRLLALCELGTHVLCGVVVRPITSSEQSMVAHLLGRLGPDMLLLWDRNFFGFELIRGVLDRGAHLLARVKAKYLVFRREKELPDGSYLSKVYPSYYDRTHDRNGRVVRIIEYTHDDPGRPGYRVTNRLLTDVLDPAELPATEAALVYHHRWEEEAAFGEIKTHLGGRDGRLRSKTPGGVVGEIYGLLLAHRVLRQVIQDAADRAGLDPDRLSFTQTLGVVRCRLPESPGVEVGVWYRELVIEVARQQLRPRRERAYPRAVKTKSKWPRKKPLQPPPTQPTKPFAQAVVIT